MASTIYDITIIGGGPIGLFTAATAGEMGAACVIVESRFHLGGIMMAAYPGKEVYNFPGIAKTKGRDLINDLIARARSNGMVARLGEYVHGIAQGAKGTIMVQTNRGAYVSSTAIITAGLKAHYSPFIDLIKIRNWNGAGIYDDWPSAAEVRGRKLAAILGTSPDQKVPAQIRQAAEKTHIVYDERWMKSPAPKTPDRGKTDRDEYRPPWIVREITGTEIPDCVMLDNEDTGERRELQIDSAIGLYEGQARQTIYSNMGIEMAGQQIRVDQRMQTSIKRVFAAGDIAWYQGKIMLLSAGIYEARIAVKNALKLI